MLRGFGARDYLWDVATEVQHQLRPGMSVSGGYYRNWFGNFRATDNLAVTPADYDPYCITAPVDTRLPRGGGYQLCGLADINPNKFGQFNNLVTQASHYGHQTQVGDFLNISANARLGSGLQFGGGLDSGRIVTDKCFVVDSPQDLLNCHIVQPFKDPRVGAVVGHAEVANRTENWLTKMQQVRYYAAFQVIKGTESLLSGTVTCASGCCSGTRTGTRARRSGLPSHSSTAW